MLTFFKSDFPEQQIKKTRILQKIIYLDLLRLAFQIAFGWDIRYFFRMITNIPL